MNIYVGNLSYRLTEDDLLNAFSKYGEVTSANIVTDKYSGQSKGFGFVEMPTEDQGEAAIKELDGALLDGRNIKVNKASPKGDKPAGGGGGRSRRPPGGGGGGGRY